MLKLKDKLTITLAVISTILLLVTMACSIYFAAFTANKTATTTLKFHDGITLTVTKGIDNASGKWQYYVNGSASPTTTGPAITSLSLSGITVQSSTTDCYLRVFVVVTTNADVDSTTLTELFADKQGNSLNDVTNQTNLLDDEKEFLGLSGSGASDELLTNTAYKIYTTPSNVATANSDVILLNNVEVFNTNSGTLSPFNGHQLKAYVCIYASTNAGEWGQGFTFSFS